MDIELEARCGSCGHTSEPLKGEKTTEEDGVTYRQDAMLCQDCSGISYDRWITRVTQYQGKYPRSRFGWGRLAILAPLEAFLLLLPGVAFVAGILEARGRRSVTFQDGSILECPPLERCPECGSSRLLLLHSAPGLRLDCPECGAHELQMFERRRTVG